MDLGTGNILARKPKKVEGASDELPVLNKTGISTLGKGFDKMKKR